MDIARKESAVSGEVDQRRTLGATCSAHAVHDGISDALYLLLPIWAEAFGLSYAASGFIKTTFSTAFATLQMPAGLLAERIGSRLLLALGTILCGVGFALAALASTYDMLLAMILITAIGSTVQHPIGSALIANAYAGGARRTALSVYNFSGDLGKMAAAALIGVGAVMIGWRNVMVGYGFIVIAVGLAVFVVLKPRGGGMPRARVVAPSAPPLSDVPPGLGLTNVRGFSYLAAIQLIDSATRVGVLAFVPFLLIAKGASAAQAGLALALLFAGGAAGKLFCGLVAARLGVLRTVALTELATAVLIVSTIVSPLAGALVLLPLLGVALNGTSSVLYGTVAEFVHPDRQARAFGLFYSLGSAAGATAPIVVGLLGDAAGLPIALSVIAAGVLATLPFTWALRRHVVA